LANVTHQWNYYAPAGNSVKFNAKNLEGIGLSLFFCRRIIEAHRRKVWATSMEGSGSIFFLPLLITIVPYFLSLLLSLKPMYTKPAKRCSITIPKMIEDVISIYEIEAAISTMHQTNTVT